MNHTNVCPGCESKELLRLSPRQTKEARLILNLCRGCGLVFANPMYSDGEKLWLEPDVRRLHRSRSAEVGVRRAVLRSRQRATRWEYALRDYLAPGDRVLEVGAGDGALVESLRARGCRVTALDPDEEACAWIRRELGADVISARVEDVDWTALGPFKAVFMLNVIEHFEDPAKVLGMLAATLVPGGLIAIETPNILRTKVGPRRMFSLPHNYYFCPESLDRLLMRTGFAALRCRVFPRDMFHLVARKVDLPPDRGVDERQVAVTVAAAIRQHRWRYVLSGQFLWRKLPWLRDWYLYGRYQDQSFSLPRARVQEALAGNAPTVHGQAPSENAASMSVQAGSGFTG